MKPVTDDVMKLSELTTSGSRIMPLILSQVGL